MHLGISACSTPVRKEKETGMATLRKRGGTKIGCGNGAVGQFMIKVLPGCIAADSKTLIGVQVTLNFDKLR